MPAPDEPEPSSCFLAALAEGRACDGKGGRAVFATRDIERGELIAVWGGRVVTERELSELPDRRRLAIQIDERLFLLSDVEGPADWFNHSCAPNAGVRGQVSLVAMRPIRRGEEITYDYAMTDGSAYDEFDCACGATGCRGRVAADDWQRIELVQRYAGFFSSYLQSRIDTEAARGAFRWRYRGTGAELRRGH